MVDNGEGFNFYDMFIQFVLHISTTQSLFFCYIIVHLDFERSQSACLPAIGSSSSFKIFSLSVSWFWLGRNMEELFHWQESLHGSWKTEDPWKLERNRIKRKNPTLLPLPLTPPTQLHINNSLLVINQFLPWRRSQGRRALENR